VSDARRNVRLYSTIKDRKSPLKGSRLSVPHGTNFLVITFPALENKRSLATDVPEAVWRLLLLTDTFGGSSPPGQWILAVIKCLLGKVRCQLLVHNLSRRHEWQTTPIQHCWTWRCSVCPTGSTPVWGRLQMQRTTAVTVRRWC